MAREGLERLDGVASVDEDPDLVNRTARLYLKKGRWVDPARIAEHVKGLQIGARVRGVEATIEGTVFSKGDELFLRGGRGLKPLKLVPLSEKIQQNPETKTPRALTASERQAYGRLRERLSKEPRKRVCITGVVTGEAENVYQLQVRRVMWP